MECHPSVGLKGPLARGGTSSAQTEVQNSVQALISHTCSISPVSDKPPHAMTTGRRREPFHPALKIKWLDV
jgi:hypothetical protein